jgi:hypothetical protein
MTRRLTTEALPTDVTETARDLKVSEGCVRRYSDLLDPPPRRLAGSRRVFTAEDRERLRALLEERGILPARREAVHAD